MTKRLAFMLALALSACAGSGSGRVQYAAAVTVRSPELVTVQPDVYVLADADEPVFYTDNYYWLYRGNHWYRSHSYDRDWVSVSRPSPRLRNIHSPTAYVRYQTRRQEARNTPTPMPQREPWRDEQPRTDVPQDLTPHQQSPLQPTEPQQAPTPNPMPPQQVPPANDHHIRNDVRVPQDGSYERAPGAPAQTPAQVKDDMPEPPPGQVRKDDGSTKVPGQVKRDLRREEQGAKQESRDAEKAIKRETKNAEKATSDEAKKAEKATKKEQKDENKKDKKRDY